MTETQCNHDFGPDSAESTYAQGGAIVHQATCRHCRAVRKRGTEGADRFGRRKEWEVIETREEYARAMAHHLEYARAMAHHLPNLGVEYFS